MPGTFGVPCSGATPPSVVISRTVRSTVSAVTAVATHPTDKVVIFDRRVTDNFVNEIYQRDWSDDFSDAGPLAIGLVLGLAFIGIIVYFYRRHRKSSKTSESSKLPDQTELAEPPAPPQPCAHSQPSQPNAPSNLQQAASAASILSVFWNIISPFVN